MVERANTTVVATTPTEQGRVDPSLSWTVPHALLRLWRAVSARARRAARLAAEAVRQALADIAETADREGPRDPKRTAAWVDDVAGDFDDAAGGVNTPARLRRRAVGCGRPHRCFRHTGGRLRQR